MFKKKDDSKKVDIINMPIWKALIILAIPIIFANLLWITYHLIDAYWVWRYSEDAFSILTLAWNVIFLIISFWSWFAIAWSILVAQYFGAKNTKMVNYISAQWITTMFIVWVILSTIWYILSPYIINWMWIEAKIYDDTLAYLRIVFIGLTFNFVFFMFQSIIRWIWEVRLPIIILLISILLNLILAPVLIFGNSIIPELWVKWAAITTLISQWLACIIGITILFRWSLWIKIKLEDFKPNFKLMKENFILGFPSSIETVARSLAFTVVTWIVATIWATLSMQSTLLSAYWAWWNALQIAFFFSMWLSMAASVIVWQLAWANKQKKAKEVTKISAIIWFVLMSILWVILYFVAPYFIAFLIPNSPEVNKLWTEMVRIWVLSLWMVWIWMTLAWALRAVGKTTLPMIVTILWSWFVKIPFAYFFSKYIILWLDLSYKWIWWSEVIAAVVTVGLMIIFALKINWHDISLVKKEKEIM